MGYLAPFLLLKISVHWVSNLMRLIFFENLGWKITKICITITYLKGY